MLYVLLQINEMTFQFHLFADSYGLKQRSLLNFMATINTEFTYHKTKVVLTPFISHTVIKITHQTGFT